MSTPVNWAKAQKKASRTARWAVTMTKVRIRRVLARTRWQLVTFYAKAGGESIGVVDLLAIRKEHSNPRPGMRRGDALHVILIQVKGGSAASPTVEDGNRLRAVAKWHHARKVLLASWVKGKAAQFSLLRSRAIGKQPDWIKVTNLDDVFR